MTIEDTVYRHEKEIGAIKQAHEREMAMMQQGHQQQVESHKRQLESERGKAANDYKMLFDSTTQEVVTLKHALDQRDKREAETMNTMQAQFKTKLFDCENTIQLLQNKLTSKNAKYQIKKDKVTSLQQRVNELEQMTMRASGGGGGSVGSTGIIQSPETIALIDSYKQADAQNQKVNTALHAELDSMKSKYRELTKQTRELLKMQQATAIIAMKEVTPSVRTIQPSESSAVPLEDDAAGHVSWPNSNRASLDREQ